MYQPFVFNAAMKRQKYVRGDMSPKRVTRYEG